MITRSNEPVTMSCRSCFAILCVFLIILLVVCSCDCNQMDPHVFPRMGPFFEGWYMRIMDPYTGVSVGWLFSRILVEPAKDNDIQNLTRKDGSQNNIPYHVNAILLISGSNKSKLAPEIKYFPLSEYSITKDGRPITRNPDDESPPYFEAKIGENVTFIVKPNGTIFFLDIGGVVIRGQTDSPVPWGPHGEGPESWIDKLPLPLHWFVYSLRSRVVHYEVVDKKRGLFINGGSKHGRPVIAHMEKNWGKDFPKAWVWAQGVDANTNASFALSSGLITELGIDIPAQLSNYRNPQKNIDCKFHPANSIHFFDHNGCDGKAYLHVRGLFCQVVFEVYTRPEFLSSCLTTPQVHGYSLGCVESYNAIANVTVFQRKGLDVVFVDSHTFHMAALEFGGHYMCNGKCPS